MRHPDKPIPARRRIFERRIPKGLYPRSEYGRAALAHALYWLGAKVCRWNDNDLRFTATGFDLYQWLMVESAKVQGAGRGPWRKRASGIETKGHDGATRHGAEHESPAPKGDAQC